LYLFPLPLHYNPQLDEINVVLEDAEESYDFRVLLRTTTRTCQRCTQRNVADGVVRKSSHRGSELFGGTVALPSGSGRHI